MMKKSISIFYLFGFAMALIGSGQAIAGPPSIPVMEVEVINLEPIEVVGAVEMIPPDGAEALDVNVESVPEELTDILEAALEKLEEISTPKYRAGISVWGWCSAPCDEDHGVTITLPENSLVSSISVSTNPDKDVLIWIWPELDGGTLDVNWRMDTEGLVGGYGHFTFPVPFRARRINVRCTDEVGNCGIGLNVVYVPE